jgi:hypothetical protein
MSEKSKRETQTKPVFSRITFFLLWVVMSIGTASLFMPAYELVYGSIQQISAAFYRIGIPFVLSGTLISALVFASLMAPVEKILLRLGLGKWVKGWISAGLLGAVLSVMFSTYMNQNFHYVMFNPLTFNLYLLAWSAILVVPQSWLMRRYGKKAWIFFALASLSNFLANFITIQGSTIGISSGSLAIGASAAVMALNFIWLFRGTPPVEKAKVDEASARLEDKIADEDDADEAEESEKRSSLREAIYAFYKWVRKTLHNPFTAKNIYRRVMYE